MSRLALIALTVGLVANALLVLGASAYGQRTQLRALVSGTLVDRLQGRAAPDEYNRMLAWVETRVPENATILILGGPHPDLGQYYLASYELVPRRVWLAGGPSSVPGPKWSIDTPTSRDTWSAMIEKYGIGYLLLLDNTSPSDLSATGFDRILWSERYSTANLVAVAPEKAS